MRQRRTPGPAESTPSAESGEDSRTGRDRDMATSRLRGVPVRGIAIAIALIALVVVLHLTGILGPGAH